MARKRTNVPRERHRWDLANIHISDRAPISVAVVGVGGTGSEVMSNLINLHLALRALGRPGLQVSAFDPDRVSEANIVRQRYTPSDIGRYKAEVLVERINLAYGLDFEAYPARFEEVTGKRAHGGGPDFQILISCVDSRASRRALYDLAFSQYRSPFELWLDTGNTSRSGQVILGTPRLRDRKSHRLPCAPEIHPELIDLSLPDDTTPSCSALESIRSQDLFVNKRAALLAVDLLWELFHEGGLWHHGCYFDLRARSEAPLFVPAPPAPRGRRRSAAGSAA
jgi:PRTRC genetic system ThiF family protein